ncbi:MAG: MOSP complex formation periplasmic protein, TDE1658 family [Treponema sp.]
MKRNFFLLFVFTLFCSLVYAQADLQPIAEVKLLKREPITLGQLKLQIATLEKGYGRKLTIEERRKVLDGIVNERLLRQAAEKEGIKIPDSQVNEYFNNMLAQQVGYPITEAEFAKLIETETKQTLNDFMKAQTGMGVVESKEFLRGQIAVQVYVGQKKGADLSKIAGPTDSEIRAQYDMNKSSFVRPDTVKLFLVVVPKQKNTQAEKDKIESIRKRVNQNIKVIDEVKKDSGEKSGYLAEFVYAAKTQLAAQQMGITMEALVEIFKQKINYVSPVTEMSNNFQFFVVMEKLDVKILALSDVIDPNQTTTVYEYIRQMLTTEKQSAALQQAIQQLTENLRVPANFKMLKEDVSLNKLLNW